MGVSRALKRAFWASNEYFFDVDRGEDEGSEDWPAIITFYGGVLLGAVITVMVLWRCVT